MCEWKVLYNLNISLAENNDKFAVLVTRGEPKSSLSYWLFYDNMKQSVTLWLDFKMQFAKSLVKFFDSHMR